MKTTVLLCSCLLLGTVRGARAGTITGTVRAEGKRPAEPEAAAGQYGSRKYKFAERVNYAELHDFVVFIEGLTGTNAPSAQTAQVVTRRVAQKSAQFAPHILPVVVGTTVEWPNHDEIFHNVFSMSDAKPFDLDLYKGNPPDKRVVFDKAGRVDVFCSIHASMNCVVLVLENPYFAVTDERGRFTLEGVPAGTYKLKAWHERLPPQVREITVPASGAVAADFVLGIKNLPKY